MVYHLSRRGVLKGLLCAGALAVPGAAAALVKVDITGGRFQPLSIFVPPFRGSDRARALHRIVVNDLTHSGYFNVVGGEDGVAPQVNGAVEPSVFAATGADAALFGELVEGNQTALTYRFVDVATVTDSSVKRVVETRREASATPRLIAHRLADAIYKQVTGLEGYFTSRILYVAESGDKANRVKRISVMDYDGANARALSGGQGLVLTPRMATDGRRFAFMQYGLDGRPQVMLGDLNGGVRPVGASRTGMTFAPRFAADGESILFSEQVEGRANIIRLDLTRGTRTALTSGPAIDTAPCMSGDGSRIVFESDRGGSPQIYVMDADGGEATRLSFGEGRYATPVFSPDGRKIAFTRFSGGSFAIGVMNADGSRERILVEDYHAEGPSFAPNGQMIGYFKERGASSTLHSVDMTGQVHRKLETLTGASDPFWF